MGSKYQQVSDWIRNRIVSGAIGTDEKVDSENDLAARFGISRQTVRHAIDQLVQEGLLYRKQGSGTYVGDRKGAEENQTEKMAGSGMISIVSTYVDSYIFPRILKSIVTRLEESGYTARITFTENDLQKEREILENYLARGCTDPLIVEPVMSGLPNPNITYYREIQKKGVPILFFHSYYPEIRIPYIGMDDVKAGKVATDYLLSMGHKKITGIFKTEDSQGTRRYQGYLNSLMEHGIEPKLENIVWFDNVELRDFSRMAPKLDQRMKDCTAVVCYNDEVAFELTKYAIANGIRIPEELSIIGIDNSDYAVLNQVQLTSVRHPMEALGRKVAEGMLDLIEYPDQDITYEFAPDLVIRDSVKQLN